ncbi:hypothetical protein M0R45_005041 [Rubus argutus]|uniref:Uncharacterized protein n=1 Tax=Rubus argutus TaxID=59490 RepID=A0AAW1YLK0_RUBAR
MKRRPHLCPVSSPPSPASPSKPHRQSSAVDLDRVGVSSSRRRSCIQPVTADFQSPRTRSPSRAPSSAAPCSAVAEIA